ncbi:MAG: cyanophycin synthetase, partial [Desulfobacterales bacterium]|nr:cyanophycin synthetase [Desulfobacterales bacterium]
AKLVGAKVAGIDIITNDPSVPLRKSGGAILEVNTTPGYYYHYQNIDGPFPIADYIFKKLFS